MDIIISGTVSNSTGVGYGFIRPDREYKDQVRKYVMYAHSNVLDGVELQFSDKVECEIEEGPKGPRAKWVRFLSPWIPEGDCVEGEGTVKHISPNGEIGFINPDVEGAECVRFYSTAGLHRYWTVGDRISFIARQDSQGRWKARLVTKLPPVRKTDEPPAPVGRDWRVSWEPEATAK